MIKFRQKAFNEIADGAWKGGVAGFSIGGALAAGGLRIKDVPGVAKFVPGGDKPWTTTACGAIIGAALGALVGTAKEINKAVSNSNADNRLMNGVLKNLNKYQEGKDFTRDPKTATLLKTKVCIAFTRDAANFKVLVNTEGDKKLKALNEKVIRRLPSNIQARHQQASNKFNEIEITTISHASSNIELVTGLISGFIDGGYPVYIIEVG